MNDEQLRGLVRDAVLRHLGGAAAPSATLTHAGSVTTPRAPGATGAHASHVRYLALVNPGEACLIEPAVSCNHCGYCQSHGH